MHTEPLEEALKVGVPKDKCLQQEKCKQIKLWSILFHFSIISPLFREAENLDQRFKKKSWDPSISSQITSSLHLYPGRTWQTPPLPVIPVNVTYRGQKFVMSLMRWCIQIWLQGHWKEENQKPNWRLRYKTAGLYSLKFPISRKFEKQVQEGKDNVKNAIHIILG